MDIGYLGAFLGGLLSLLSPCSVLLLPAFFAYAFSHPATLLTRTGVFYLGLVTTLVPLGVLAGTAGAFLSENRALLLMIVAVVVIAFGVVQMLGVTGPSWSRASDGDVGSAWTVYLLGAAYGVAGVCTGPILGSVLMIAAVGANPVYGALLLAVYAAGMALPLLFLALAWKRWAGPLRNFLRPRVLRIGTWSNSWHAVIAGGLALLLGIALLFVARSPEAGGVLPIAVQYRLETAAARADGEVGNVALLAIAALLIVVTGTFLWWRDRTRRDVT